MAEHYITVCYTHLDMLFYTDHSKAVRRDEELQKLFAGVTIADGGVLPNINPAFMSKTQAIKEPIYLPSETKSPKNSHEYRSGEAMSPSNDVPFYVVKQ
ncbi:unnamed protein product [Sphenostylis stenocarpa]|uniref:Histone H2A C-terminal domain-containing protein n=1 Tax=Sphenostylis stenocarpa TaxID=92480 RepID=A0AA86SVE2_9FABA|nr:unnamed protein product [Sphenostylis stenocarpa]